MAPIIHTVNLRKVYAVGKERVVALNDVSISIENGEFCCIVGQSGSGKSTLLNQLAGLEKPTRGKVFIGSHEISAMTEDELAKFRQAHLGFIFQSYNLLPTMTAAENVALPLMFKGISRSQRLAMARKELKNMGLGGRAEHMPTEMSGGQQQRVGIARAFVSKPRVIFADEPTGNLDSITSKQVLYRMLQISKQMGTTFVMVTHEPELASCADRIITILDGKVQSDVVQDPATRERNREAPVRQPGGQHADRRRLCQRRSSPENRSRACLLRSPCCRSPAARTTQTVNFAHSFRNIKAIEKDGINLRRTPE